MMLQMNSGHHPCNSLNSVSLYSICCPWYRLSNGCNRGYAVLLFYLVAVAQICSSSHPSAFVQELQYRRREYADPLCADSFGTSVPPHTRVWTLRFAVMTQLSHHVLERSVEDQIHVHGCGRISVIRCFHEESLRQTLSCCGHWGLQCGRCLQC